MRRVSVTAFLLLLVACGGKAIDDPNYDGPKTSSGDTKSSGGSNSSPDTPGTEKKCADVCREWELCTPAADGTQCSKDCINNYRAASAIGCGSEYDALLNCYASRGVCDSVGTGCEGEANHYVDCYN